MDFSKYIITKNIPMFQRAMSDNKLPLHPMHSYETYTRSTNGNPRAIVTGKHWNIFGDDVF